MILCWCPDTPLTTENSSVSAPPLGTAQGFFSEQRKACARGRALTRVKEHGPLEVGVLLGTDVQAPALGKETLDGLDFSGRRQMPGLRRRCRRRLQRGQRRRLVARGLPPPGGEDPLQQAGLRGLYRLKVQAVLGQLEHEQRRPAVAHQHQLLVQREHLEAG